MASATSFCRSRRRLHRVLIASTIAPWFMIVPSTIVWGGSGSIPKLASPTPFFAAGLSATPLIDLDPMSRPMQFLAMITLSYLFLLDSKFLDLIEKRPVADLQDLGSARPVAAGGR